MVGMSFTYPVLGRVRMRYSAPIAGLAALLLSGPLPGWGTAAAASIPKYSRSTAHVAACARAGAAIALPARFPRDFPMPFGTVIDRIKTLSRTQVGVYGYVPVKNFSSGVTFFKVTVPKAGYSVTDFQADFPHDSEGTYRGKGFIGRWQLRALPTCKSAMFFAVSAEPIKR